MGLRQDDLRGRPRGLRGDWEVCECDWPGVGRGVFEAGARQGRGRASARVLGTRLVNGHRSEPLGRVVSFGSCVGRGRAPRRRQK